MNTWTWKNFLWMGIVALGVIIFLWWIAGNAIISPRAEASFTCIPNNADCQNASDHSCCAGYNACKQGPGNSWHCRVPTSTPTPTPHNTATPTPTATVTPTVTLTPTPTGKPECDGDCDTLTPTPTQAPEATPTPTVASSSPVGGKSGCDTNCGGTPPATAVCTLPLKTAGYGTGQRISSDTVRFVWNPSTDPHDKQVLLYGPAEDQLIYSVLDIPAGVGSWEVHGLTSAHWFGEVGTWKDSCIVWGSVFDP